MKVRQSPKVIMSIREEDLTVLNILDGYIRKPNYFEYRDDLSINGNSSKSKIEDLKKEYGQIPIIYTYRTKSQFGEGKEELYKSNVNFARNNSDIDIIDIEWSHNGPKVDIDHIGKEVILSYHSVYGEDVKDIAVEMANTNASIIKLAVDVKELTEVIKLLEVLYGLKLKYPEKKFCVIAMGEVGRVSRIYLNDFTYCSLFSPTGKGQIDFFNLTMILQVLYGDL